MGRVSHDVHGAWDETVHPRDAHGKFITKGANVRLPDGSVGKVVASRDSTIGAVITVRRRDGSILHIPSAQTAATKQKATNDPVRQAGLPNDFLSNHTPERGTVATAANTTPGHRVAVAGGRTGTITAVRPASGTATYVEDGTQNHRTGLLNRITHLGASQPDRGTPANLRNTQPGHHVAIVGKDDSGNKTLTTGTVVGVHANPGTNTPSAEVARDGSGNIVQAPLDHMSHLPTIAQLAHGNPPPRIPGPIVADDARAKMIEQKMDQAVAEGKATDAQFKDPKTGLWSQDRAAIHQQIVDEVYAKFANVPSERKAIIAGGLPGAGKTTILKKNTDLTQYVNLNPDDMKEELIKRGLAPQVPGLTPMESVMLIHEESSDLTKMLAERAYRDHKNVMWDITMQSPGSVRDKLGALQSRGYTTKGVFVSTTLDRSLANVRQRWSNGIAQYNNGQGFGGRYVPEHISRSAASDNALFRSKNEDTFSQMRRSMDDWELWDNSQNQQRLVITKAHTVQTGGNEDAPLSIEHPQPGADKFIPEPTPEPKPELPTPEPAPTAHMDGVPLDGPGTRVAERFQEVTPVSAGLNPQQRLVDTRRRLYAMSNINRREGYTSDSDRLENIANANDLTVSDDGTIAGGSPITGNGGRGPFQVVAVGSGTPLRPRDAAEPADKQQLVNDLAAIAPFGNPAIANRWQDRDQRVSDQQSVTDAWNRSAPEPDSSTDAVGSPLTVGVPVSYTTESGEHGTGTVAEINNNWGGGSSPHAIVINRDTGGQEVVPNRNVVSRAATDAPTTPDAPSAPTTPGGPATNAQIGDRVQFLNNVRQQVSGTVTHRSTIGDSTILQVEQDNGMYHAVNADNATMDGPGAPSTTDRRGNSIRVGDQVYVGSGTGKVVSISPDGQFLRVGRSSDGADPFGVSLDRVDSVKGYTPFGPPPQVGEKINVGGESAIVTDVSPSSARRGDYLINYRRTAPHDPNNPFHSRLGGDTGSTRLSNLFLTGPNAPQASTREGHALAVGDQVSWGNSGMSSSGTGRVTELRPNLDNIASGGGATHQAIIRGDDGQERAINTDRLSHWQPAVGTEIIHNGERGTVTGVQQGGNGGQPIIHYKAADGQMRATTGNNVTPAPPPLPADLTLSTVPEATYRRWGPRAAEIAASGGPNLTASGLQLNNADHQAAFRTALNDMYNGGENGGLGKGHAYKVQVNNIRPSYGGTTTYDGSIIGPDGGRVGNFTRTVHFKNGKPSEIHNDLMSIVPEAQGQGIARDFYRRQENWAIRNGIPKITVQANINIGGYTWGRLGYDWQSKRSGRSYAQNMMNRISRDATVNSRKPSYDKGERVVIGSQAGKITEVSETSWGRRTYQVKLDNGDSVTAYPQEVLSEAVKDNQAWVDLQAIQQKMIDDPKYVPTPYELGKIGYTPGQTTWPGKRYMLGTSWYGVKRLNPRNRLAGATEEAPRSATAAGWDESRHPRGFHGKFAHLAGELAALQPHQGGWTTKTRAQTVDALKHTPEGPTLLRVLDSFQHGSAVAIPRLRTDVQKAQTGGELPLGRKESVETLLDAIGHSTAPKPLFRGMSVPGSPQEVLARYRPGSRQDVAVASFSLDPGIARSYTIKGAGQRVRAAKTTPVLVQLPANSHALPIENLSPSRVFAEEREWVTSGQFEVTGAKVVNRKGVSTVVVDMAEVVTPHVTASADAPHYDDALNTTFRELSPEPIEPEALAAVTMDFGWTEGLHPRGKDGKFITKGGFVRLPNGVTGEVKGAKAGKDGGAIIQVKTDGPDGKTVSVAADQLEQGPQPYRGMRVIQTKPRVPAADLINAIKANGGFTYNPQTGGLLIPGQDKGFAVAVPGTEHVVGNGKVTREAFRKGVVKVLSQYQPEIRKGAMLGGYYSEDRNAYMVELTDILPQEDPAGAISEGKARNQEGIYDIGNDKFIGTGGTGDG